MEKSEFTTLGISNLNPDYFRGMVVHCPKAGYIAGLLAKQAEKIGEKCRNLESDINNISLGYSSSIERMNIRKTKAVASETLILVDEYVKATERLAEDLSMIHPGVCCHCKYLQHFNNDSVDCTYVVPEEKKEEEEK